MAVTHDTRLRQERGAALLDGTASPRILADWQREMRYAYRGASYGQFASGAIWLTAAATATWGSARAAVLALAVGGMAIYPLTVVLMRLDGRRLPAPQENPLQRLGAQVALVLPLSMPALLPLLGTSGILAFFPCMLILVGAHYLPFAFLYGMRAFLLLAAVMVGIGVFIAVTPTLPFASAAWTGAMLLLLPGLRSVVGSRIGKTSHFDLCRAWWSAATSGARRSSRLRAAELDAARHRAARGLWPSISPCESRARQQWRIRRGQVDCRHAVPACVLAALCHLRARRNRLSCFPGGGMRSMASRVAALVLTHGTLLHLIAGCTAGDASRNGDRRVMHDTIRASAARCALSSPLVIRADSPATVAGAALLQRYDVHDVAAWESTGDPAGPEWAAARVAILALAPTTDPVALLLRYPTSNNRLVARHAAQWLAPVTCLEKALLGEQHARVPFLAFPSEFIAFVLQRPDTDRLRIWYYTMNRNGSGSMTPLTTAVMTDLQAGWMIRYSLHNHPFAADTARWHGIPGPSAGDAQFHQNYTLPGTLPEARITNGFLTVRIPSSAFGQLTQSDEPVREP